MGFMAGSALGPLGIIGAILGVVVGSKFDKGVRSARFAEPQERLQIAFFTTTFAVMGYVAKVDGHVSQNEIEYANFLMRNMSLDDDQRQTAIGLFQKGKENDFPLDEVLEQFRRECGRQQNIKRMFMEIQFQSAFADGRMDAKENEALYYIADRIGFSREECQNLFDAAQAGSHRQSYQTGSHRQSYQTGTHRQSYQTGSLNDDYKILGISSSASDDEVKRAYRRLMSRYHPDKLVSKGLPDEMIQNATEKTREIRSAYERIRNPVATDKQYIEN